MTLGAKLPEEGEELLFHGTRQDLLQAAALGFQDFAPQGFVGEQGGPQLGHLRRRELVVAHARRALRLATSRYPVVRD